MELTTCARPYSVAAFSYAKKTNNIDNWLVMLEFCSNLYLHKKIQRILSSYTYNKQEKTSIFIEICKDKILPECQNFLTTIFSNNRIKILPIVVKQFNDYKLKLENKTHVKCTSAFVLNKQQQKNVLDMISAKIQNEIILEEIIDKSILGGFIIEADDFIIDASLQTRIVELKNAIST